MIKRINNKHKDFYKLFGAIFGSRKIEARIKDRIYDDDLKEWIYFLRNKKIIVFISIKHNQIKNVWCDSNCEEELELILKEIYSEITNGIVPKIFKNSFKKTNYSIEETSSNFIKIQGGFNYEEN